MLRVVSFCTNLRQHFDHITKGKEPGRICNHTNDCRPQAPLLDLKAILDNIGNQEPVQVREVGSDADSAADKDTEEDETRLTNVHAVDWAIYKRKCLEEGVVDAVDQLCIDVCE